MSIEAFQLYPALSEKDEAISKASCIGFAGEMVYIGTKTGEMYFYKMSPNKGDPATMIVKKRIGTKPVQQIEVVKELEMFFILCGGSIFVHRTTTFEKLPRVLEVDNVHMFCVEKRAPFTLYTIAKKSKKALQYKMKISQYTLTKDINIKDIPLSMAAHHGHLLLAYKKEYTHIEIDSGLAFDLPVPPADPPVMQVVDTNEIIYSAAGDLAIYMGLNGEPVNKSTIGFAKSPIVLARSGNFLLALLPNDLIQIISLVDQTVTQTVSFPKGITLVADDKQIIALSQNSVSVLYQTSVQEQVKQYLHKVYLDEAQALMMKSSPSPQEAMAFHTDAGWTAILNLHFDEFAMHLSQSSIDPREIIALFPDLTLKGLPYKAKHPRFPSMTIERAIEIARQGHHQSDRKKMKVLANKRQDELMTRARFFLAQFLWSRRTSKDPEFELTDKLCRSAVDTALLTLCVEFAEKSYSVPQPTTVKSSSSSSSSSAPLSPSSVPSQGVAEEMAVRRTDVSPAIVEAYDAGRRVEEGLVFPFSVNQLIFPHNDVLVEEALLFLLQKKQFNTAALVVQSKGDFNRALNTWSRLGSGEFKETLYSATPTPQPPSAAKTNDKPVSGVRQTVALLSTMDDQPLLWEYAQWVLHVKPSEGLKIFTSSSRDHALAPDAVLPYLKKHAAASADVDVVEAYLEHIVRVEGNKNPVYHNELVSMYLAKVRSLWIPATAGKVRPRPGLEHGLLGQVRGKLYKFLTNSLYYESEPVLRALAGTELYEEQILVHANLNHHKELLKVYVFKLRDHEGAAAYCSAYAPPTLTHRDSLGAKGTEEFQGSSSPAPQTQAPASPGELLLILAELYLSEEYGQVFPEEKIHLHPSLQGGDSDDEDVPLSALDRTIKLFNQYSNIIDPVKALKLLPSSLPLRMVSKFLHSVLPRTAHTKRHTQIVKSLTRMENLNNRQALVETRSVGLVVEPDTRCPVCKKPIGESIFSAHPPPLDQSGKVREAEDVKIARVVRPKMLSPGAADYVVTHYNCAQAYRRPGFKKPRTARK